MAFPWDGRGNQTAKGTSSFTFDQANRLATSNTGGQNATYTYNGEGVRIGKTVGGVTTSYLQDQVGGLPMVLVETTGGRDTLFVYGAGLAFEVRPDGTHRHYHTDALGSTKVVTDDAGAVVSAFNYDAYGAVRQSAGEARTFTYTGEQVDESALVFLRARSYDPATGRFLQKDRLPTPNRYAYANGNPIRYIDPAGTDWIDAWEFIQGVNHGFSDSMSLGISAGLRDSTEVRAPDSEYYYLGRVIGDAAGLVSGAVTTGSGAAGMLVSPVAGPAAPAVAVGSGARAVAGTAVTANSGHNLAKDLSTFFAKSGQVPRPGNPSGRQVNRQEYPSCIDPRTGQEIPFPGGELTRLKIGDPNRTTRMNHLRDWFMKEWEARGFDLPEGGWNKYQIHHIRPLEFGGTNDFENLVPVPATTHPLFNDFWRYYE